MSCNPVGSITVILCEYSDMINIAKLSMYNCKAKFVNFAYTDRSSNSIQVVNTKYEISSPFEAHNYSVKY